jgi:membrane protein
VLVPVAADNAINWTDAMIAALVDLVLAGALLAGVPRLRIPWRRLWPAALLVVLGLGVLKVVGRWFITRTQHNPAYESFTAAAAAVGLLLFMFFFHQLVLFATALAATSGRGKVYDLTCRPPAQVEPGTDADAARNPNIHRLQKE